MFSEYFIRKCRMYNKLSHFGPDCQYGDNWDRRQTIRIKRSGLHKSRLHNLDKPAIKFAQTRQELEQSFALVYRVYQKKGFIVGYKKHPLLYNIYSLLPQTAHIIAKSNQRVISNLTEIRDSREFGLPMDVIYKPELDSLRAQNRNIVELSALATPTEHRWQNIFLYLVQVMYWHSIYSGVDDVCIAVNPRQKSYYMHMFPFEEFGPLRHHPRVNAPAVGLRGRVYKSLDRMMRICNALEFDTPLYRYFYEIIAGQHKEEAPVNQASNFQLCIRRNFLPENAVAYFMRLDPTVVQDLSPRQKDVLQQVYPDLSLD